MSGYLDILAKELHEISKSNGFWEGPTTHERMMAKLNYCHEEISEITQAYKKDHGSEAIVEEVADVVIRLLDWLEAAKQADIVTHDLTPVLAGKIDKNRARDRLHGKVTG